MLSHPWPPKTRPFCYAELFAGFRPRPPPRRLPLAPALARPAGATSPPAAGARCGLVPSLGVVVGGNATDARGTAIHPIYGPALDGTLPGNEVIVQSNVSGRVTHARAMGPMQFLPDTWARYASDGKGGGVADPQNLYDSTLAAARYLCSGGLNLRDPTQVLAAILRYNNSMSYAQNVLGWAAAYATGVIPIDLPPITGPPPPLGDAHDEHPEGLGPGLPMNIMALPVDDSLAHTPLIDFGPSVANQPPTPSGLQPAPRAPTCTLICIGSQDPAPPLQPPGLPAS